MENKHSTIKRGSLAEKQALIYLQNQGLRWVCSNYRCRWGEIDLIMQENHYLLFIEVRLRTSHLFGGAIESITMTKQKKIIKTALHYLRRYSLNDEQAARFDVISFQGNPLNTTPSWIKNAFDQKA